MKIRGEKERRASRSTTRALHSEFHQIEKAVDEQFSQRNVYFWKFLPFVLGKVEGERIRVFPLPMKRHHEDHHYGSNENSFSSLSKRISTRNEFQLSDDKGREIETNGRLSPPSSSNESDSSNGISSSSSRLTKHPLCRCPMSDCVVHHHRYSKEIPDDLRSDRNPQYGSKNLLLHFAHLERCRRHGNHYHLDSSSSSS